MDATVATSLQPAPLESLKADRPAGETALQKLSPLAGELVAQALRNAAIDVKVAASVMGISYSLLQRQLKNHEHLSWQRVYDLGENAEIPRPQRIEFQRQFICLLAQAWKSALRGAVRVDRRVV